MRGKAKQERAKVKLEGITPAYAGKSVRRQLILLASPDHPRVCGEKFRLVILAVMLVGSPPRMRGKVIRPYDMPLYQRITPAYAGKRKQGCTQKTKYGDHPRVCGEKQYS